MAGLYGIETEDACREKMDELCKSFKSDFEKQVVTTPEPGIAALMLAGIGFLLVMRKRCASGLTPTS
jgi:hypothetical protein